MRVKWLLLASMILWAAAAQAQYQFHVLHAFTGGSDGGGLWGSVAADQQGNLYGVTFGGGPNRRRHSLRTHAASQWRMDGYHTA